MSRNKVLRSTACFGKHNCPRIEQAADGFKITGTNVPDPELPGHERTVLVPASLLPELADLEIPDVSEWINQHRRTDMIRVQTLMSYAIPDEDRDFEAYRSGRPRPPSPDLEEFYAELREDRALGLAWRNLILVDGEPTPYQRWGFEWVVPEASQAGQETRVINLAEQPAAAFLRHTGDFWVVEHRHVALARYDSDGHYLGVVGVGDGASSGYAVAAELAWSLGQPWAQWWTAHPEYARAARAAA